MAGFRFPSAIFCNLLSTRWLQPSRGERDATLVNTGVVMVNNGWGEMEAVFCYYAGSRYEVK